MQRTDEKNRNEKRLDCHSHPIPLACLTTSFTSHRTIPLNDVSFNRFFLFLNMNLKIFNTHTHSQTSRKTLKRTVGVLFSILSRIENSNYRICKRWKHVEMYAQSISYSCADNGKIFYFIRFQCVCLYVWGLFASRDSAQEPNQ